MMSALPFAVVLLLSAHALTSISGNCDLISYKGSRFWNSARVHKDFNESMEKINEHASFCGVEVKVLRSFRKSPQVMRAGAIVKPAKRTSNHFVGHAISMEVIDVDMICRRSCLSNYHALDRMPKVDCFIERIRSEPNLRWGGDLTKRKPELIDDGLNIRKPNDYKKLYDRLQKDCR